jgi:hypothetical protein
MSNVTEPFEGVRLWQAEDGLHIDVRGLPCPEPMVTLLRMIDSGKVEGALFVHLSQEPLLLYPELDLRGWRYQLLTVSGDGHAQDGDVVLAIVRSSP